MPAKKRPASRPDEVVSPKTRKPRPATAKAKAMAEEPAEEAQDGCILGTKQRAMAEEPAEEAQAMAEELAEEAQVGKKKYKQGERARREILTAQWTSENAIPKDHFQRLLKAVLRETLVQAGHDPRKYKMSAAGAAMIQLAAEEVCCENLRNLAVLAAHRNWSTIQRQDVLALQHLVDGLSLSTLGTLKADMRACIHRQEADYAVLCRHKATKRRQLLKQYLGKGLRLVKADKEWFDKQTKRSAAEDPASKEVKPKKRCQDPASKEVKPKKRRQGPASKEVKPKEPPRQARRKIEQVKQARGTRWHRSRGRHRLSARWSTRC